MDPDQTNRPTGAVLSGSTMYVKKAKTFQQTTIADNIGCDWHLKG